MCMNPSRFPSESACRGVLPNIDFASYSNSELRHIVYLIRALEKYGIEQNDDLVRDLMGEINRRSEKNHRKG